MSGTTLSPTNTRTDWPLLVEAALDWSEMSTVRTPARSSIKVRYCALAQSLQQQRHQRCGATCTRQGTPSSVETSATPNWPITQALVMR